MIASIYRYMYVSTCICVYLHCKIFIYSTYIFTYPVHVYIYGRVYFVPVAEKWMRSSPRNVFSKTSKISERYLLDLLRTKCIVLWFVRDAFRNVCAAPLHGDQDKYMRPVPLVVLCWLSFCSGTSEFTSPKLFSK